MTISEPKKETFLFRQPQTLPVFSRLRLQDEEESSAYGTESIDPLDQVNKHLFYRPQTKFAKVMFLPVSVCPHWGGVRGFIRGACMVLFGGHVWFYSGVCVWFYLVGGVHGFIWGVCMVLFGGACMVLFGGHVWFYLGGMHGFIWGACVVLFGGACVVLFRGMHGFIQGGMCGFIWGGMHGFSRGGVHGFFSFFGYNEIRSMSGQYASYWNAFLLSHYWSILVTFSVTCSFCQSSGLTVTLEDRLTSNQWCHTMKTT